MMPVIPNSIINTARYCRQVTGVPASVQIAQWAVESDFGTKIPPGSNNPFGMKAKPGRPSVQHQTREFINGEWETVTAAFRKFGSIDEAFLEHAYHVSDPNGPYAACQAVKGDPEKFIRCIGPIYATDPDYVHTLLHVINECNLWKYDNEPSS